MPKRLTTADFIERAKAVHGDRYDYSLAVYQGIHKYVTIVCTEHGQFQQSPANHYQGKGCADCGGGKPHTTESFIEAAKAVHGERYDYSQVDYEGTYTQVTIICSKHGPFVQSPTNHLAGKGCLKCGILAGVEARLITTEQFIAKASAIHDDRYDYSKVLYVTAKSKVTIICPEHGGFEQEPTSHLAGRGCPKCGILARAEVRRKTTEQFIARANAIHGDRYDYSQVDYEGAHTQVTIICSNHGPFVQSPSSHLAGQGCPKCGLLARAEARRKTTEQFIAKASAIHDDRYDYSKVEYVAAIRNVTIICPVHGEFEQRPANHYIGHGCPECGGNKPLTLDRFIERANEIHKSRYDYSRVEFKNVESKVEIICPDHGPFLQRLMSHLRGFGCDRCGWVETANKLGHTRERFIEDARRAHGDRYDYSQVEYVNALSKVTIICPDHGPFRQNPANHIRDVGCPKCGSERAAAQKTKTTEYFVQRAREVHGDRYDYSRVEYKSSHKKVEIVCPEHGPFWQSPANHTKGDTASGCPGCALSGFDQTKPGLLYYIAVTTDDGDTRYKIGITNLSLKRRFSTLDRARIRIVKTWQFEEGHEAAKREAAILSQFTRDRYYGPDLLEGARNTEMFTHDVLGLDNGDHEHGQSVVDAEANLIGRQIQLDLGFD
ncbi:FIG00920482: hypothetical protein [Olavius algarvensis associated proteobacterium Delta 3]|nr:FIG00920482: hypothetical protein [Olavius algarvensis associated proteobacterium Delta 3]